MPKIVDHNERKSAFIEAACRVIVKHGLARMTVRAIAEEAGYTTGALVHYFESKDQVLIEASRYSANKIRDRMLCQERERTGHDALKHVVYEALPMTAEMRGMWNFRLGFWDRASHNETVRATIDNRYAEWQYRIARIIRRAKAAGELAAKVDPIVTAQALISLVDGIAVRVLLTGGRIAAKRQKELVDGLIDNLPRPAARANVKPPKGTN
jgi:AcrR family transcriptional regulator